MKKIKLSGRALELDPVEYEELREYFKGVENRREAATQIAAVITSASSHDTEEVEFAQFAQSLERYKDIYIARLAKDVHVMRENALLEADEEGKGVYDQAWERLWRMWKDKIYEGGM